MTSRSLTMGLLVGAIILAGCSSVPATGGRPDLAQTAEAWLRLLDEERYEEAWTQTTPRFQAERPYQAFVGLTLALRRPLGAGVKREAWDKEFLTAALNFPDGQYFSASFKTSFPQKKAHSFEYVLLKYETGAWLVTSYCLDNRSLDEACPPSSRWWAGTKRPAALFQPGNK